MNTWSDNSITHRKRLPSAPEHEWKNRKKKSLYRALSMPNQAEIFYGFKIRKEIQNALRKDIPLSNLFMEKVSEGSVSEVKSLLHYCKNNPKFNLNISSRVNQCSKSALRVAVENRDSAMCELLLDHKISVGDTIFQAVNLGFLAGVQAILKRDKCLKSRINTFTSDNYKFDIGMTPMALASFCNNYEMLQLLHDNGHQLLEPQDLLDEFNYPLESAAERKLRSQAMCSPAYITMYCENYQRDPFEYCLTQIRRLRSLLIVEREQQDFYKQMIVQIEDFMTDLLKLTMSSYELSKLFSFDYFQTKTIVSDEAASKSSLELLDKACKERLFKFVTHKNSQIAIEYHLNQHSFVNNQTKKTFPKSYLKYMFGFLFFIWPFLHFFQYINPKVIKLLRHPSVLFQCHVMSEIVFICILFADAATKPFYPLYLGSPPTVSEWLIFIFVMGRFLAQVSAMNKRGLKDYLQDTWNLNHLIQLVLFFSSFITRIVDFFTHFKDQEKIYQDNWPPYSVRILSTSLQGWANVFAIFGALSLMRTSRVLGPLRISLSKMLVNVAQFFVIFSVVFFSFAVGVTDLYMHKSYVLLSSSCHASENCTNTENFPLSTIWSTMLSLFWGLFGYFEISDLTSNEKSPYVQVLGSIMVGAFHVVMILILFNMLIAMMAKSFDKTNENKDAEWKFYRTEIWIRFIRNDFSKPPPMNLLFDYVFFKNLLKKTKKSKESYAYLRNIMQTHMIDRSAKQDASIVYMKNIRQLDVAIKLIQRYKIKYLLKR